MSDWKIYHGTGTPGPAPRPTFPEPPPWRHFGEIEERRATTFRPPKGVVEVVNAAIWLARPILVTGDPGTGKSSLAYSIANELGLGTVLAWPINSRSTLTEGLYQYDALARLREVQRSRGVDGSAATPPEDIGRYMRLGPLGTAFVAKSAPRVVLVDEIDKSDIDLPNDLLHVLENGEFEIPELIRIADRQPTVEVGTADGAGGSGTRPVGAPPGSAMVKRGFVRCAHFPLMVITSNGDRELPPAFLRRCLRIDVPRPNRAELEEIVRSHFGGADLTALDELLSLFLCRRDEGRLLATDQLLNAFFLVSSAGTMSAEEREVVVDRVLHELGGA